MNLSKSKTLMLAAGAAALAICMILLPEESFEAAQRGLNMWWEIVFPSLFPFFVISELLIGFGVVMFMGVLLEPFMRPLFNVPGAGGFAWAMGMATGFPAGAKLSARLRKEGQLTRTEAERLASFTNSSSPLFIFGAVAVGFFHDSRLGFILAFAHYAGNFLVGLTMRFYGEKTKPAAKQGPPSVRQALAAMHRTRKENNKPLGKLMGDAVISSINTLLMIGGFIILFSVVNKLLYHINITAVLGKGMEAALHLLDMPIELGVPLIAGIFELTLGSQMTSQTTEASLMQQIILTSFILGFSGFSVQAQAASIMAQTDIRFAPFFAARILHGLFAGVITFFVWPLFEKKLLLADRPSTIPVFYPEQQEWWEIALQFLQSGGPLLTIGSLIVYTVIVAKRINAQ